MTNNNQQNQNQQRTSPFRRSNNNTNNNQNNQNNQSTGARSGNRNNNNNNNQRNNNSRFSSRFSRFGRQTIYWTIAPLTDAAVRISLDGLGDPFHRLLGTPLDVTYGKPEAVAEVLQEDEALLAQLAEVLDEAWESYQFKGAALLYPWDEDVRKAYTQPTMPDDDLLNNDSNNANNNQNNQNNRNNNASNDTPDWLEALAADQPSDVTCLRAIDLAFVLNVLARSRANVVVADTPLALEPGFLTQTVVCDDPRIVALARATGCIDEVW